MKEESYFGIDGKPCLHKDGYAKLTQVHDERGNLIGQSFLGVDGKPCLHNLVASGVQKATIG
jgi:hypothetical protein